MSSVIDGDVASNALNHYFYRSLFYTAGRYWCFYYYDGDIVYKTSLNGSSWSSRTVAREDINWENYQIDFTFDGTYIHYTLNHFIDAYPDAYLTFYRRGRPLSDGTIEWSDVEQYALIPLITNLSGHQYYCDVAVADGHAYLAYMAGAEVLLPIDDCPYVNKNDNTDGTWCSATNFPQRLSSSVDPYLIHLEHLGGGNIYVLYYDGDCKGRMYNGSVWLSEETIASSINWARSSTAARLTNGDLYFVYRDSDNDLDTYFRRRDFNEGWKAPVKVRDGYDYYSISSTSDKIYIFWVEEGTDYVYYRMSEDDGETWTDADGDDDDEAWIDETTDDLRDGDRYSVFPYAMSGRLGIAYQTVSSGIKFNQLEGFPTTTSTSTSTSTTLSTSTSTSTTLSTSTNTQSSSTTVTTSTSTTSTSTSSTSTSTSTTSAGWAIYI